MYLGLRISDPYKGSMKTLVLVKALVKRYKNDFCLSFYEFKKDKEIKMSSSAVEALLSLSKTNIGSKKIVSFEEPEEEPKEVKKVSKKRKVVEVVVATVVHPTTPSVSSSGSSSTTPLVDHQSVCELVESYPIPELSDEQNDLLKKLLMERAVTLKKQNVSADEIGRILQIEAVEWIELQVQEKNDAKDKYTTTKNLILGKNDTLACRLLETKPVVLVDHHIDHLNHTMYTFADKPVGYIVLVEMISVPKVGTQASFIEYALLIKEKEGWMLLFKRTINREKKYWDVEFFRENCSRMDVGTNTIGAMENLSKFISTIHYDYLKKYLMVKPDGFKVLVRVWVTIQSRPKKNYRVVWKSGEDFLFEDRVGVIDSDEIFWDKVCTENMFMSKIHTL